MLVTWLAVMILLLIFDTGWSEIHVSASGDSNRPIIVFAKQPGNQATSLLPRVCLCEH